VSQLDIALAHAGRGRRIFPFKLQRREEGGFDKIPLVKWKDRATNDEDQIRRWSREFPTARWGWVLPEGFLVADIDDQEAFDETGLDLPAAPSQETPSGGLHFLYTGVGARQTVKQVPGLDTRVGGKGWVGLYSADSFVGIDVEAPAWLLMERAEGEEWVAPTEDAPISTRAEILELVGRYAGLPERVILDALLSLHASGAILDGDSARPWLKADFKAIATEFSRKPQPTAPPEEIKIRFIKREVDPEPNGEDWTPLSEIDEVEPSPLLLDRLDPDDHTILYGTGGTGKGVVAAEWAVELVADPDFGADVLVIDYEQHAKWEWRPRVRRFLERLDSAEERAAGLERIWIYQPNFPIWRVAKGIRDELDLRISEGRPVGYVIVDSVSYAVGDLEAEKSSTATKYTKALHVIDMPCLSLAHTTKADADPRYPFGSVYWHNGARVTMSLVGDGPKKRVLTQKKSNTRRMFKPAEADWGWTEHETQPPVTLGWEEHAVTAIDIFYDACGDRWWTAAQAYELVLLNGGKVASKESLKSSFDKHVRGVVVRLKRHESGGVVMYARRETPWRRSYAETEGE